MGFQTLRQNNIELFDSAVQEGLGFGVVLSHALNASDDLAEPLRVVLRLLNQHVVSGKLLNTLAAGLDPMDKSCAQNRFSRFTLTKFAGHQKGVPCGLVWLGRQNPVLSVSVRDAKFPVTDKGDHHAGVVAFAFTISAPPLPVQFDFDHRITLSGKGKLLGVLEHDV
jgi:hypothetical protein